MLAQEKMETNPWSLVLEALYDDPDLPRLIHFLPTMSTIDDPYDPTISKTQVSGCTLADTCTCSWLAAGPVPLKAIRNVWAAASRAIVQ